MAAEVKGDSREAQMLSLGDENALSGGPTKRMKKLVETAEAPAEILGLSIL